VSQQINLFDPALRPRRDWLSLETLVAAAAVLLAGLLSAGLWGGQRERMALAALKVREDALQTAQAQLSELAARQANRQADSRLTMRIGQRKTWLEDRRQALALLQGGSIGQPEGFANFMAALARQTPEGLWLTGFDIQSGGNAILLRGRLVSEIVLPMFVERLNHEVDLRGRRFAALEVTAVPAKAAEAGKKDERTALERSGWLEFILRGEGAAGAASVAVAERGKS
jgi:hypothetical protein